MANIINGTDTGSGGLITTGDSSDELQLQTAETARVTLTNTAVVVNEDGNDVDFRVEGDTDANLLFVDASADAIGIGTNSPVAQLHIVGNDTSDQVIIENTDAGSLTAPDLVLYRNSASPAASDNTGYVVFRGKDSAGNPEDYASILAQITSATSGSEGGALIFETNNAGSNTERARVTSDGYLRMASGSGGIQFGGDTAAANALDDYEEGTFDPTIVGSTTAGTASYTDRNGRYTKIGNRVLFTLYVNWTGGTGTGSLRVEGLPFTAANASNLQSVSVYNINVAMTANHVMQTLVAPNATRVDINSYPTGGGSDANVNYDSAGVLFIGGQYETA